MGRRRRAGLPLIVTVLAVASPSSPAPLGAQGGGPGPGGELRWVDGPAGRLRVLDTGPAPGGNGEGRLPVVFIHSLAGSREHWRAQVEHLRGERRTVAIDLRGHGDSEPPGVPDYSVPSVAGDVEAVADALGLESFVLVGHSLGGAVAAAYAGGHPARVAGLLFVDPVGDQRMARDQLVQFLFELDMDYRPAVERYWDGILADAAESTRERVVSDLRRTPPEAVIRALEGLLYFDPSAALEEYRGPMLSVVTPMNDLPLSLHEVIPRLEAVTVKGTSHWLQMDRPEVFHRHLDGFLARVEGEAGE